ncbi:ribosomal RNA small subunit methyltransferase C [Dinoroseobacter shibae DFL 12 = DSM 16493]|jgi:16S rRNA (guanine1207-N2)-methyltransferase|uniref:Ribosomal RNA small subunit methyltransferase C n=1 Tax=Dinoroseobacter shibae (strain DSM 16493 / NCIMB 14021 / DFL 12) TaxID=398580 RepID=A8LQD1_DINSH|nr:class I SAM-dependent methyltransferase [Dinoroseobacter shibae]ABV92417.1 ribosomal RNA small subunit methyltransferase C [Dinoroseobacter shibae DFL 12 = DSM 16493]URF47362.1 class I SAM-dependent methyltransferase [Dinoroseobacter shibae]URF51673.1 class I SAM-dependent methyltransferase [Dinoroseobacter shibae]
MTAQRLRLALDAGLLEWPDGPVLALRPPPGLEGLPEDRFQIVHGFRPDVTAWERRGALVQPQAEGAFATALVCVPRAKDHARALLAEAIGRVGPGGLIVLDGQKTDGVDSLVKLAKSLLTGVEVYAKAHGKLLWGRVPDPLPDLAPLTPPLTSPEGWVTARAGFSAGAVDAGSALLAAHLPARLQGDVLDLGAGWGYLAKAALASGQVTGMDLVEAEFDALEAARRNVDDPRARFLWEDAAVFAPGKRYDAILCNPPFHTSRKADPAIGQMFLRTAARLLKPSGVLGLVANRHLPYEHTLAECFGEAQPVTEAQGYKIFHARKPRQTGAARAS